MSIGYTVTRAKGKGVPLLITLDNGLQFTIVQLAAFAKLSAKTVSDRIRRRDPIDNIIPIVYIAPDYTFTRSPVLKVTKEGKTYTHADLMRLSGCQKDAIWERLDKRVPWAGLVAKPRQYFHSGVEIKTLEADKKPRTLSPLHYLPVPRVEV